MNEQMDKVMADYEQLKNKVFDAARYAETILTLRDTVSAKIVCVKWLTEMLNIISTLGLTEEYERWCKE